MDADFIKQAIFAFIRIVGGPAIAWLSLKIGVTTEVTTTFIVGALTTAVLYIWSLFNKARYEEKVNTALELPGGSSKDKLKHVLEG